MNKLVFMSLCPLIDFWASERNNGITDVRFGINIWDHILIVTSTAGPHAVWQLYMLLLHVC